MSQQNNNNQPKMSKEKRRLLFEQKYKDSQMQTPPQQSPSIEIQKETTQFQNHNYIFDHTRMIHHHHLFNPNEYSSSPAYFNLLYLKLFLS